jgi:hypothetical protein
MASRIDFCQSEGPFEPIDGSKITRNRPLWGGAQERDKSRADAVNAAWPAAIVCSLRVTRGRDLGISNLNHEGRPPWRRVFRHWRGDELIRMSVLPRESLLPTPLS